MSEDTENDKGKYLSNLIKEIIRSDEAEWKSLTSPKVAEFAKDFEKYYQQGNFNMYSASYRWIVEAEDGTDAYLSYRLGLIERYLRYMERADANVIEKFVKLRDYISLEAVRAARYRDVEILKSDAQNMLSKIKTISEKAEEERKESAAQTITVLSIFTGIAMAFFGGFSLLGSAFNNIAYGLPSAAIMAILVGIVLFNTVFSFIYFASKISGHTVSNCKEDSCRNCNNKCYEKSKNKWNAHFVWLTQFNTKYPYIVAVNGLLVLLLIVFIISYVVLPYHGLPETRPTTATSTSETAKPCIPCSSGN